MKRPQHVAVFQLIYRDPSSVEARHTAEEFRNAIAKMVMFDAEDDDTIDLIDVVSFDNYVPNSIASVAQLRKSRNILLRLKTDDAYNQARELDRIAWRLEQRIVGEEMAESQYNYTHFMQVAEAVWAGKDPLD